MVYIKYLIWIISINVHMVVTFNENQIGNEFIYTYRMRVKIGTLEPVDSLSEYEVTSEIHLHYVKQNTLLLQLKNIKYRIENSNEKITRQFYDAISTDVNELELPFKITYNEQKRLSGVVFELKDRSWSINMKKSIAALFQVNYTLFVQDFNYERFEEVEEETLYGTCKIKYIISPKYDAENVIIFHKSQNPFQCFHDKSEIFGELTSDNRKTYILQQNNTDMYIRDVTSVSEIVETSLNTKSLIHILQTNQRLSLISIENIHTEIPFENDSKPSKIEYTSACLTSDQLRFELQRQPKMSQEFYLNKSLDLLEEIIDYVDTIQITGKPESFKKSQVFNRLIHFMENLDVDTLQKGFISLEPNFDENSRSLKSRKFRFFLKTLPFVGTKATVTFLVSLIRKNRVESDIAVELIQTFALNIKCPSEDLLAEMEALLKLYDEESTLNRACILAFATYLNKGFKYKEIREETLRKYLKMFVQKIDSSKRYLIQMLYIKALGNIDSPIVFEYLKPYINMEKYIKHDLKILCLWSSSKIFYQDNQLMNKYLIPILLNRYQNSELRIVAYSIIVTSRNDLVEKNFLFLYWFMMTESDDILYNFHYNTLTELAETSLNSHLKYIAGSLLRTLRKPIQFEPAQGILFNEFKNKQYHSLGGAKTVLYNTRDVLVVYSNIYINANKSPFNLYSIYMKIRGATLKIRYELLQHLTKTKNNSKKNLFEKLSDKADDNLHIEISLSKYGQTIINYVIDKSVLRNMVWTLMQINSMNIELNRHHENLDFPILSEKIFQSEAGVPFVLNQQIPILSSLKFRLIKKSIKEKINIFFNVKLGILGTGMKGMKVYNPINDYWHGVVRVQTVALIIPLQFNFTIDFENLDDIDLALVNDDEKNEMGYQNHIATFTYIRGSQSQEVMKRFNSNSLSYTRATQGDNYRKNIIVLNHEVNFIGKKIFAKYFDCERPITRNMFIINALNLFDSNHQYIGRQLLSSVLKSVVIFHTNFWANDNFDNCGFIFSISATKIPIRKIKIHFGLTREMQSKDSMFLKEENVDFHFKAEHESYNDQLIRSYKLNASLVLGFQHRNNWFSFSSLREEKNLDDLFINLNLENVYQGNKIGNDIRIMFGNSSHLNNINITLEGRPSERQRIVNNTEVVFSECRNNVNFYNSHFLSFPCVWKATLLYKYAIEIMYSQSIMEFSFMKYWPILLGSLSAFGSVRNIEENVILPENIHYIDLEYSTLTNLVDIGVRSKNIYIHFSDVPTKSVTLLHLQATNNIHFSSSFRHLLNLGFMKTCSFDQHKALTAYNEIIYEKPGINWTLYAADADHNFQVYARQSERFGIKIKLHHNSLEIHKSENETFILNTNGKMSTMQSTTMYMWDEFFDYIIIPNPLLIILSTYEHGINLEFNGHFARIHFPIGTQMPSEGLCFQ